jgi:hypothetical protein
MRFWVVRWTQNVPLYTFKSHSYFIQFSLQMQHIMSTKITNLPVGICLLFGPASHIITLAVQ